MCVLHSSVVFIATKAMHSLVARFLCSNSRFLSLSLARSFPFPRYRSHNKFCLFVLHFECALQFYEIEMRSHSLTHTYSILQVHVLNSSRHSLPMLFGTTSSILNFNQQKTFHEIDDNTESNQPTDRPADWVRDRKDNWWTNTRQQRKKKYTINNNDDAEKDYWRRNQTREKYTVLLKRKITNIKMKLRKHNIELLCWKCFSRSQSFLLPHSARCTSMYFRLLEKRNNKNRAISLFFRKFFRSRSRTTTSIFLFSTVLRRTHS